MATIMKIGGGGGQPNVLTVSVDSGATVTASNGKKTAVGTSINGSAVLKLPEAGMWAVVAELDGQTAEDVITISDDYPVEVSFGVPVSGLAEGALIKLNENGSGVNFYLAKKDYESGLNGSGRYLLVRKDLHSSRQWHSSNVNAYATSSIDTWLNGEYVNMLPVKVREAVGATKFYYTPGNGNFNVTTLERKVFLLSFAEMGFSDWAAKVEGSKLPTASTLGIAYLNGTATTYWVRTPATHNNASCYYITEGGSYLGASDVSASRGIRPCFTIPATALISPNPNADGSYTLL